MEKQSITDRETEVESDTFQNLPYFVSTAEEIDFGDGIYQLEQEQLEYILLAIFRHLASVIMH